MMHPHGLITRAKRDTDMQYQLLEKPDFTMVQISFDQPGAYAGIGAYEMEIWGRAARSDRASERWDDVLRATLAIRVLP